MRKRHQQLIEIVAKFPKELVIALRYAGISDLIGAVKRQFWGEFYDHAGVHIARGLIPRVPFGRERQTAVNLLFEGQLPTGAIGARDNVSRKVVSPNGNPRAMFPLLRERRVSIIPRVVGPFADWKKQVIANEKGPSSALVAPKPPFDRGGDFEFPHRGRAQPVEIHSDFDLMPYAKDDARCKRGQGIDRAHGTVLFEVDLSFVQDVRAGNVEYGFLCVDAADRKGDQQKHQQLEGPDF
jgi:hypothetical protein